MDSVSSRPDGYEIDILVIGAGPAGMSAAIVADSRGMETLLIEKTAEVGGTAAWSAGMMWFVDTQPMRNAGFDDSSERAGRYFAAKVGDSAPTALQQSFITKGRIALDYLVRHSELRVVAVDYPDYYSDEDGGMYGRAHAPLDFDGRLLGKNFKMLRGPIAAFAPLGGMMLNFEDIMHFMSVTRSAKSAWHIVRLLARHAVDRVGHHRGTRLVNGNALVGRLYKTIIDRKLPLWIKTTTERLIVEDGRVVGAEVTRNGTRTIVRARRGVIIATGGYPANRHLRRQHSRKPVVERSISLADNVGDGIALATAVGGRLDHNALDTGYYVPVSEVPAAGKEPTLWGHWGLDRAKPGFIAVDQHGERFANEAASYHEFALRMFETRTPECWLIADAAAAKKYGIGAVNPGGMGLTKFVRNGYLQRGATMAELAKRIGVDPSRLKASVVRYNGFAANGVDEDFDKGASGYDKFFADHEHRPNMCVGPLARPPYYAVKMFVGDFGTSRGLVTGPDGEVSGADDRPIPGLYAAGNDINSPTAGQYLGAGITLGPALTFGYLAATALAEASNGPRPEPTFRTAGRTS